MTWHTEVGVRVLEGAEAKLVAAGVDLLAEALENWDDDVTTGVRSFDRITRGQQVAVLHNAAYYLLTFTPDLPQLTAALEGAVAAVFSFIGTAVAMELEAAELDVEYQSWRTLVRFAAIETGASGAESTPAPDCKDESEWDILLHCLSDRILWDADYEDEERFIDLPPEEAALLMDELGIERDYFQEMPDDLDEAGMIGALEDIRRLIASVQS